MALAAKENATSTQKMSDLEKILNELLLNSKINESSILASHVQNGIVKNVKAKYKNIKNRGVKQAPFYVLIGAHMPAVLIELSFITNKEECRRLSNSGYQDKLSKGIVSGIKKYINENKKTSL
jgi:N-acetylmuramoyl-L-alanine amidase